MAKRYPPQQSREKKAAQSEHVADPPTGLDGLVISNYGQTFDIEDEAGGVHRCTVRKKVDALVCGDKVVWQDKASGGGVIVALHARRTLLVRPDSHGVLKPIAANADQLLVVITPHLPATAETDSLLDTALIDHYLVAAELCRIQAVIVINKTDLLNADMRARALQRMKVYQGIGYPVLFTSAKQRHGGDELITALQGHTSVICGPSGVGKSSLVKTLLPGREIRIGALSESTGAGRHTTTLATLYHLPRGGSLIDSPGVRDFNLWHATPPEIARGFVEFQHHAQSCRYADCAHLAEPGCAVRAAAETGAIDAARFDSYRRIVESL